eukprot:4639212-Amphidinium_carterae.3
MPVALAGHAHGFGKKEAVGTGRTAGCRSLGRQPSGEQAAPLTLICSAFGLGQLLVFLRNSCWPVATVTQHWWMTRLPPKN